MKLTIVHQKGSHAGSRQVFEGERISFGRATNCDCLFVEEEDPGVSGNHARISVVDDVVSVIDLDSTNGLLVNNVPATTKQITSGDLVQLGPEGPSFIVLFQVSTDDMGIARTEAMPTQKASPASTQKKYGEGTVGLMIQQALSQAGIIKPRGTTKSTDYFESLVDKKVKRTSARFKLAIGISAASLIVIGCIFGYIFYRNRSVQVYQTTQVNYGEAVGSPIAAANRYTVFMLAGNPKAGGTLNGFCSGFAISSNVLATNAHCILTARKDYTDVFAIMNGAPQGRYKVVNMVAHPEYRDGQISPDVGLLVISGQLPYVVTIAGPVELKAVAPGTIMFLYGFPGRLNREEAPEATFVKGDIGRVTNFAQKRGQYEDNALLQHSAFSSSGTSGSPIFNSTGQVIGINAGGYIEKGTALTGYNFGMRVDLINSLFSQLDR
jgi:V8-like Glu-specific endopeptidase